MKKHITRSCGHSREYNIIKKGAERYLRSTPCPVCSRADELKQAAGFERLNSLPLLHGSEKQIQWATLIRCRIINEFNIMAKKIQPHQRRTPKAVAFFALADRARRCTSAAAWIDRAEFRVNAETINAILSKGQPA